MTTKRANHLARRMPDHWPLVKDLKSEDPRRSHAARVAMQLEGIMRALMNEQLSFALSAARGLEELILEAAAASKSVVSIDMYRQARRACSMDMCAQLAELRAELDGLKRFVGYTRRPALSLVTDASSPAEASVGPLVLEFTRPQRGPYAGGPTP